MWWTLNAGGCWCEATSRADVHPRDTWRPWTSNHFFENHLSTWLSWFELGSTATATKLKEACVLWYIWLPLMILPQEAWASLRIVLFSAGRNTSDVFTHTQEGWWCIHSHTHTYNYIYILYTRLVQHRKWKGTCSGIGAPPSWEGPCFDFLLIKIYLHMLLPTGAAPIVTCGREAGSKLGRSGEIHGSQHASGWRPGGATG